eukprot:359853-Chlamydomonas_euryale.AAC.9
MKGGVSSFAHQRRRDWACWKVKGVFLSFHTRGGKIGRAERAKVASPYFHMRGGKIGRAKRAKVASPYFHMRGGKLGRAVRAARARCRGYVNGMWKDKRHAVSQRQRREGQRNREYGGGRKDSFTCAAPGTTLVSKSPFSPAPIYLKPQVREVLLPRALLQPPVGRHGAAVLRCNRRHLPHWAVAAAGRAARERLAVKTAAAHAHVEAVAVVVVAEHGVPGEVLRPAHARGCGWLLPGVDWRLRKGSGRPRRRAPWSGLPSTA